MHIMLGSQNPVKFQAVQEVMATIPLFAQAVIQPVDVESGVSRQPRGLEETILGAGHRAKKAFLQGDLGIGLESGIIDVTQTRTGFMNLTACVIFDGTTAFTGLGPAFELPYEVTSKVIDEGLELSSAVQASGMSDNPRIGYDQGIIGLMTKGRVTRMEYIKPAVLMALAGMDI